MTSRLALLFVVLSGCFTAVGEVQCVSDAQCQAGETCVNNRCLLPDGGAGASSDGGAAAGGGTAAGGGVASGGGAAQGGGSGGGNGAPDGGVCGCKSQGGCVPGDSPFACGAGGGVCVQCQLGQQCVNGGCVTAACGPGTCTGCCAAGLCVTPSMENRFTCGAAGAMCAQCPQGETCVSGVCQISSCSVMSCPGCCQGNQCQPGNSPLACGAAGVVCQACAQGTSCQNRSCQPSSPDAGAGLPIGGACGNTGACLNGFCVPESGFAGPTGFPGGYCSASCANGALCPGGSTCVNTGALGVTTKACFAVCPNAEVGMQSVCRSGYVCAPGGQDAYCASKCTNGGLAACPNGKTCNQTSGLCQ
jgi:hypothetical protein